MPQSLHPPTPSQVTIILQWDIGLLKVFSVISWPSQVKRSQNEIVPCTATWMNLETITLSEVSQTKTNPIGYHLYVESKIGHKWTYLWNGNRLRQREQACSCQRGGMDWEFGVVLVLSRFSHVWLFATLWTVACQAALLTDANYSIYSG